MVHCVAGQESGGERCYCDTDEVEELQNNLFANCSKDVGRKAKKKEEEERLVGKRRKKWLFSAYVRLWGTLDGMHYFDAEGNECIFEKTREGHQQVQTGI